MVALAIGLFNLWTDPATTADPFDLCLAGAGLLLFFYGTATRSIRSGPTPGPSPSHPRQNPATAPPKQKTISG
ncbi:MAG: hypothetical protein H7838_05320 [Magnetococcus sp. DMHC-8]